MTPLRTAARSLLLAGALSASAAGLTTARAAESSGTLRVEDDARGTLDAIGLAFASGALTFFRFVEPPSCACDPRRMLGVYLQGFAAGCLFVFAIDLLVQRRRRAQSGLETGAGEAALEGIEVRYTTS